MPARRIGKFTTFTPAWRSANGDLERAHREAMRASALDATESGPDWLLANLFFQQREYASAAEHFAAVVELEPEKPVVGIPPGYSAVLRAGSLWMDGRGAEAVACLSELGMGTQAAILWHGTRMQGAICIGLGRLTEATQHLERALALAPTDAQSWSHLGTALHGLGDDAAIASFEQAVEHEPGVAKYRHNLGVAQLLSGDRDGAEATLLRATELPDCDGETWFELGKISLSKQPSAAREGLERFRVAAELPLETTKRAHVQNARAACVIKLLRGGGPGLEERDELLEEGLVASEEAWRDDQHPVIGCHHAELLALSGEHELAARQLEDVLALHPDSVVAREQLADLLGSSADH